MSGILLGIWYDQVESTKFTLPASTHSGNSLMHQFWHLAFYELEPILLHVAYLVYRCVCVCVGGGWQCESILSSSTQEVFRIHHQIGCKNLSLPSDQAVLPWQGASQEWGSCSLPHPFSRRLGMPPGWKQCLHLSSIHPRVLGSTPGGDIVRIVDSLIRQKSVSPLSLKSKELKKPLQKRGCLPNMPSHSTSDWVHSQP